MMTRLLLAEWHYARAWPPVSADRGLSELLKAEEAYPFLPRFREGPGDRLKLYVQKGI